MQNGELLHREYSRLGEKDDAVIDYTTWCDWKQVSWHNQTSDRDDPPNFQRGVLPGLLPDTCSENPGGSHGLGHPRSRGSQPRAG
jgi:hypothetical protein